MKLKLVCLLTFIISNVLLTFVIPPIKQDWQYVDPDAYTADEEYSRRTITYGWPVPIYEKYQLRNAAWCPGISDCKVESTGGKLQLQGLATIFGISLIPSVLIYYGFKPRRKSN
jgi:hypothetical protein